MPVPDVPLSEPWTQMNVRLEVALLRDVRRAAKRGDLMLSQWIRQAIREKLERDR